MGSCPEVEGCSFCEIVCGIGTARVVYEADDVLAFLPLVPAVAGHILIVPKHHIPDIWSLQTADLSSLASATIVVAWAIRSAFEPDGLNIINSNGEAASQTVQHLHIHVVPRWHGDHFGKIWPDSPPMSERLKDEIAERIRRGKSEYLSMDKAGNDDDATYHR